MFKINNNKNTNNNNDANGVVVVCLLLTLNIFHALSSVSIVTFEQVNTDWGCSYWAGFNWWVNQWCGRKRWWCRNWKSRWGWKCRRICINWKTNHNSLAVVETLVNFSLFLVSEKVLSAAKISGLTEVELLNHVRQVLITGFFAKVKTNVFSVVV